MGIYFIGLCRDCYNLLVLGRKNMGIYQKGLHRDNFPFFLTKNQEDKRSFGILLQQHLSTNKFLQLTVAKAIISGPTIRIARITLQCKGFTTPLMIFK